MDSSDKNKSFTSRIPVRVTDKKIGRKPSLPRQPLKTISNNDTNVPNNSIINNEERITKPIIKVDTRHVTVRTKNDEIGYYVFRDDSITNVTSEVSEDRTPQDQLKSKNIKQGLKRPRSPGTSDENVNKKRFFESDCEQGTIPRNEPYEVDVFRYLLENEEVWPYPKKLGRTKSRACSLNWMLEFDVKNSGNPAVVQTAAWYFDSIYSRCNVQTSDVPVAVTACLWISRKIHGKANTAKTLVHRSGKVFNVPTLCRTEWRILKLLNFPRLPHIPQEFIDYLAWRSGAEDFGEIQAAASLICTTAMILNLDMCSEYPSTIALAAVKIALLLLKKGHLIEKLKNCVVYKPDLIEVCMAQIRAFIMLQSDGFEFTAPNNLCRDKYNSIPQKLSLELHRLCLKGETLIRELLL
ncbi:unnamed protein product [Leptosia nina]|uniref:Cyclin N-terminal domain-containing protein n=1 Tax=Leptosia nina TaxID=320188 RepID=A0AAV1JCC7_9NEOP